MVIQRAECWWGAGERSGAPQQKRKKQKINKKGNIYIIIYFAIYIIPCTTLMITATEWLSSVRNVGGVRGRGLGRGQRPLPASKKKFCYIRGAGSSLTLVRQIFPFPSSPSPLSPFLPLPLEVGSLPLSSPPLKAGGPGVLPWKILKLQIAVGEF